MSSIGEWRWVVKDRTPAGDVSKIELIDGQGRDRATVFAVRPRSSAADDITHVWNTWRGKDRGENGVGRSFEDAKDQAVAAIVRQGWAPGGWRIAWDERP